MSINDEQFEMTLMAVSTAYSEGAAEMLRARDTAQREALARVEAERDRLAKRLCICHSCGGRGEVHTGEYTDEGQWQPPEPVMVECGECGGDGQIGQVIDLDNAQAQLAEAVGVIRNIAQSLEGQEDCRSMRQAKSLRKFLSRHAQAEQQEARQETLEEILNSPCAPCEEEAQGAQAGDERAGFKKEYDAFRQWAGSRLTARQLDLDEVGLFYDEIAGFAHDAWQARAALATQPVSSTTSDQYRAELYDEVWQNARSMGYGNVTDALSELERFKLAQAAAGKPAAVVEQTDYPYPVSSQIDVPLPVGTRLYTLQPAAGEPVAWECVHGGYVSLSYEKEGDPDLAVPLFRAAPPAAAHGDEAVRKDAARYRWLRDYHIGDDPESINLDRSKRKGLNAAIDAAMRAQGDWEVQ